MGKLHELLAVDKDAETLFKRIINETEKTFTHKMEHFRGMLKTLEMVDEERQFEADALKESKNLVTTVPEKLEYTLGPVIDYINIQSQKELTNQSACADVIIDGQVILQEVPATTLLTLEKIFTRVRGTFAKIPTLDPAIDWIEDNTAEKPGVYKAVEPEIRNKTEKTSEFKVIVQPTEKHPAQVKEVIEDNVIGRYITKRTSGMITPFQKSQYLRKIEKLLRAFKQARTRANNIDVVNKQIGADIIDYIMS